MVAMAWVVDAHDAGVRLDKFLAAPGRAGSRARAVSALERGKVFVNGQETTASDASRRLATGDTVRLWMDRPGSARTRRGPFDIDDLHVLHEDDSLVVVDKPAGMLTIPLAARRTSASAIELLQERLASSGRRRLFVVHRIDEYTSGLVVFARTAAAQEALKAQFMRREPERVYWAVVYGRPDPPQGVWRDFVFWDPTSMILKATRPDDPDAKEAISHYRVLDSFATTSLVEVRLETGKRNQIRLQARLRGHMLVGERRYVFGPAHLRDIDFPRQALHARYLAFRHPRDGRTIRFEAPLPQDMADLIGRLRSPRPRASD